MASSVWKGHLTFGLVSFPIRLFSAARSETVSFNLLHKEDHSRIRQVIYCQAEDKPVPRSELVKGYEYEKDQYVEIDDEDIKKVAPKTAKVMEILEFVKAEQMSIRSTWKALTTSRPMKAARSPTRCCSRRCANRSITRWPRWRCITASTSSCCVRAQKGILSHTMYYAGRNPPRGRIPHRHQPGEGKGTGHGEDADFVAGSRIRAAEIPRRLPRQSAEDDRGQNRRAQSGGDAQRRTWRR